MLLNSEATLVFHHAVLCMVQISVEGKQRRQRLAFSSLFLFPAERRPCRHTRVRMYVVYTRKHEPIRRASLIIRSFNLALQTR